MQPSNWTLMNIFPPHIFRGILFFLSQAGTSITILASPSASSLIMAKVAFLVSSSIQRVIRRLVLLGFLTAYSLAFTGPVYLARGCIVRRTKITSQATYYDSMGDDEDSEGLPMQSDPPTAPFGLGDLHNERAKLARVVAAFPPPGQALDLKNIADVNILEVDGAHMDVQATVCEEETCAAVAVPVIFPHPCAEGTVNMNECVLGNLDELDHEAELLLKQTEWEATNYELHEDMKRQRRLLLDHDNVDFPSWWVAPNFIARMAEECETMRNLLNEAEFQMEVRSLAASGLATGIVVEEAAVSAVGPAGLVLKILPQGGDILDISIPFPTQATTVEQLRDLLTDTIGSINQ